MPKNSKYNFLFSLIFFALFFIYFAVYSYFLNLNVTLLNLAFVAMFNLSYLALLNFINQKWWYLLCHVGVAVMIFFGLINFAYFQVFGNFINISLNQLTSINSGLVYIFKDFYHLVPIYLYLASLLLLLSLIFTSSIYLRVIKKEKIASLFFQNTKLNVFINKNLHPLKKAGLAILFFIFINFSVFNFVTYLQQNPKADWWKTSQKINDIGFLGDFYEQIFKPFLKNRPSQIAQELVDLPTNETISAKQYDLPADSLQQTKYIYQTILPDLSSSTKKTNTLPNIPAKTNVLVIQLESVSDWAINNDPSPMPFLKSLIKDNISVSNFHSDSCQTINAEFLSLCSFWPASENTINNTGLKNDYNCLSDLVKNIGYETYYFHSDLPNFYSRDVLLPKWSFDNIYLTPYFRQKEDDEYVFTHSLDVLAKSKKPFFAYVLSFTTHGPHNQELIDYNLAKNNLKITPWHNQLNTEYVDLLNSKKFLYEDQETIENYLGFLKTTDDALKNTFKKLADLKMLDNTLVVIYNDHRFYNFFTEDFKGFEDYNLMPFVIVTPNKDQAVVQSLASQIDIAPTIWHLLKQSESDMPVNFMGTSLFSPNYTNQVLNKCLDNVYYLNDDVLIEGSNKSGLYNVSENFTNVSPSKKKNLLDWVKKLVSSSDQALKENKLNP